MIELRRDTLEFSFPEVHRDARLRVTVMRTLRIPDDGRDWPLPPGLGTFPLRHVDDFGGRVPAAWAERGGVMLPMYQAEALWLKLNSEWVDDHGVDWPFALKVAAGKRCALTADAWREGLDGDPQNYLVVPSQPWLDGFAVEKGFIRQFVAMPLGEGYTAEEQLTGAGEVGGLQLQAFPMKRSVFMKRFPKQERRRGALGEPFMDACMCPSPAPGAAMGLAPGGRMRQEIHEDPYGLGDWDLSASSRCFVHLTNSLQWRAITGEAPPTRPVTAADYANAGLPWFEHYDADAKALAGSDRLAALKSVAEMAKLKGDPTVGDAGGVKQLKVVLLGPGRKGDEVREGGF